MPFMLSFRSAPSPRLPGRCLSMASGDRRRPAPLLIFSVLLPVLMLLPMLTRPAPSFADDLPSRPAVSDELRGSRLVERARRIVDDAAELDRPWGTPGSGFAILPGRHLVYLAQDMGNGGIAGVAEGLREAAGTVGWTLTVLDAGGDDAVLAQTLTQALRLRPDALVLGGADALVLQAALADRPEAGLYSSVPVFAWHGAPMPGRIPGTQVHVNVTSNSQAVAELAATVAIADSKGQAGVVILTDGRFAIAREKAAIMQRLVESCHECRLLAVEDVAISDAGARMKEVFQRLNSQFGSAWTHTLAINDVYFDALAQVPQAARLRNISAGDGSSSALSRLLAGGRGQIATVPEPLLLQGWQLVDEIGRHFAGQPPSGFVPPVAVLTAGNAGSAITRGTLFDPPVSYRAVYRSRWQMPAN
jgi:ribose transport system substrate-binding protein